MKTIKQVMVLQCDIYNVNTQETEYKHDILIMEDINNKQIILDLTNGNDLTRTFWTPIIRNSNGKVAKIKQELFRNSSVEF